MGQKRIVATSINQFTEWLIIDLDLSSGTLNSVSTAPCGLDSSGGTWTTDTIAKPAGQSWEEYTLTTVMKMEQLI